MKPSWKSLGEASPVTNTTLSGGLVVLLVKLDLNVDEHDPVARLGDVVALEICHGAQAHDTL
jgi:hypothetical protein